MSQLLDGIDGVLCHMDDVLISGKDQTQHDIRLTEVLTRLDTARVTLNKDKCLFNARQIRFLGHVIDSTGVRADPEKLASIQELQRPTNVTELRRFIGMTNQLSKFSSRLAEYSQPLRELLSTKRTWTWGPAQEQAFSQIKEILTQPTVLTLYDLACNVKVSADASSHGLGAVLLQQAGTDWKPVA